MRDAGLQIVRSERFAEGVDQGDGLRGQAATQAAYDLILLFAPVPCWLTRTSRAVDQDISEIGIVAERLENPLPDPILRPAPEARIDGEPLAERFRQIAPRRAGARNPKKRFDKEPVVTPAAARVAGLARQLWRDPLPLAVTQHQSNQG